MELMYTGRAHRRVISAEDLTRVGISGFETTTWLRGESKTVQDAGGQWLVDNLSTEFKKVETLPTTLSTARKATDSTSKPSSGS